VRRVLVTRPEPGATKTRDALQERNINAAAIPLYEILPLTFEAPALDFDGIIITSQNAIIHGEAILCQNKLKPAFVVGNRTAQTLRDLGHTINAWAETVADLLPLIVAEAPKHLCYICGTTRRPELELGLHAENINVLTIETYQASRAENASAKLSTFFATNQNAIVLIYAPSAADAFNSAMRDQTLPKATQFLCMSPPVAALISARWQNLVTVADHPDEASMIKGVDKLLAQNPMRRA
jgi:uroporphyrinogen-III synthase